jgi:hypothetical protein
MPIVLTDAGTDLNAQIAAHVLHGVALRSRSVRGDNDNDDDSVYLDISPAAVSARSGSFLFRLGVDRTSLARRQQWRIVLREG